MAAGIAYRCSISAEQRIGRRHLKLAAWRQRSAAIIWRVSGSSGNGIISGIASAP
jgi:hypothetical protein